MKTFIDFIFTRFWGFRLILHSFDGECLTTVLTFYNVGEIFCQTVKDFFFFFCFVYVFVLICTSLVFWVFNVKGINRFPLFLNKSVVLDIYLQMSLIKNHRVLIFVGFSVNYSLTNLFVHPEGMVSYNELRVFLHW